MPVLTDGQVEQFQDQGFLLVSGLVDDSTLHAAVTKLEAILAEDSRSTPLGGVVHGYYEHEDFLACFSLHVQVCADRLSSDKLALSKPQQVHTITVFPETGEWHWKQPHIDFAGKEEAYNVFPPPVNLIATIYLNDVVHHGGGSVFWPKSHKLMERLALENAAEITTMYALNERINFLDFGMPVELLPQSGDVLFYHYLSVHAGSKNLSGQIRMVLNTAW